MERSTLGQTLRDRVKNKEIRRHTGVDDIIQPITKHKWRWTGQREDGPENFWSGDQEPTGVM